MARKQTDTSNLAVPTTTTVLPIEQVDIERHIVTIRGVQVMLDSDLAKFYGVETKRINEQVRRNAERFPSDFVFQLTPKEYNDWKLRNETSNTIETYRYETLDNQVIDALKSQNATIKKGRGEHVKYLPYVFTEEGVAQLSGVLRSSTAAKMSVKIARAFVAMRRFLAANAQIFQRLDSIELKQLQESDRHDQLEKRFDDLLDRLDDGSTKPIEGVFVEGQVLDARMYFEQLIASAQREVVLIDGYIDATTFHILESRALGVRATIYTESVGEKIQGLIEAHDTQYPNRTIEVKKYSTHFHDRFMIIDDMLYHLGASLKDAGKRLFAFEKMRIDKNLILGQL